MEYQVHDSGEKVVGTGGMLKDASSKDKPIFNLIDLRFLTRFAHHMTRGMRKYERDNWRRADAKDRQGFQDSAFRHLVQWLAGEEDEDHAAAVCANIMMFEATKGNVE